MTQPLILIGGGEHARVVAEAAMSRGDLHALRGFIDPAPCDETVRRLGIARLGDDSVLRAHTDAFGVIAVGSLQSTELRRKLAGQYAGALAGFATVVHAAAWVSPTASLEPGTVVMATSVVQSGAHLHPHCIVNSGAVVEHDVRLGAFTHVAPGAVLGGGAQLGEGVFVGLGASVRDHVQIGDGAVIGMGAVVVRDVGPGETVKGVAAR